MSRFLTLSVSFGASLLIALPGLASGQEDTLPPPGAGGAASDESAAVSLPADINGCAVIDEGIRRLACYDHFLHVDTPLDEPETGVDPNLIDAAEALGLDAEAIKAKQAEKASSPTLVEQILARQRTLFSYSGSLVTHRQNYLLPISYMTDPNSSPSSSAFGDQPFQGNLDKLEAKFQLSLRLPILTGIFDDRTTLWVAYTQESYWQGYNGAESSPFRETNYEPEIFLSYQPGLQIGPGAIDLVSIGFNHQSNGRSDPFSRSWNRILGNIVYSTERWVFAVSPWYRIPESDEEDNNPDIHKYLGYATYRAAYKLSNGQSLGIKLYNNLDLDDNRTSIRLDWTFPISGSLDGYIQYYNGWGESLIDYNHHLQRIGVGIMIADWLG